MSVARKNAGRRWIGQRIGQGSKVSRAGAHRGQEWGSRVGGLGSNSVSCIYLPWTGTYLITKRLCRVALAGPSAGLSGRRS
jgi:hypothetical protein